MKSFPLENLSPFSIPMQIKILKDLQQEIMFIQQLQEITGFFCIQAKNST